MENALVVKDIFIYPIKSLGGIRLSEAVVEGKGFQYDRRWMLVDEDGVFISQRDYPQLALLNVELGVNELMVFRKNEEEIAIQIPLEGASGPDLLVTIWDDQVSAKAVHPEISKWFSDYLGIDANLVVMPESSQRKVDPRYAINGESVSFADGMPYLLIGQESLNELNSRLEISVPMDRFRPNIVFSGGTAFQEDFLRKIRIGPVDFVIVKPCARCVMTTVDQETGKNGKEPLRTLSTYRTLNNKVYFGQNMIALGNGKVRIGDQIQPLE